MIVFDLQCANGHTFEGWFEDGQTYQRQRKKGQIACPVCDDTSVSKIPSSFAVKASQTTPDSYGHDAELLKIGKKMVDYVKKNFDDVGCDFAKEALKMHYGVSEHRNIRGVSTDQEEKTLKDEGIKFFKIPMPATPDTET
jgi:hypothetical protein